MQVYDDSQHISLSIIQVAVSCVVDLLICSFIFPSVAQPVFGTAQKRIPCAGSLSLCSRCKTCARHDVMWSVVQF